MAPSPIDCANHVLARYWQGRSLPVDPMIIAKAMGLGVVHSSHDFGWYDGPNRRVEVNTDQTKRRQTFCVAHVLGHHVMGHTDCPRETTETFSTRAGGVQEWAANEFAGHLLVPSRSLQHLVVDKGWVSLERLADAFGASTVLLHLRLRQCGLIS